MLDLLEGFSQAYNDWPNQPDLGRWYKDCVATHRVKWPPRRENNYLLFQCSSSEAAADEKLKSCRKLKHTMSWDRRHIAAYSAITRLQPYA